MEIYALNYPHFPRRREPYDLPTCSKIIWKCSREHRECNNRVPYVLRNCSPRGRFHAPPPLRNGPRYLNNSICSQHNRRFHSIIHIKLNENTSHTPMTVIKAK